MGATSPGSGGCAGFYTAPDGNSRYDMPGAGCAAANAALNASVALVQRTTPGAAGMNASALASLAVKEFNAAARTFWLKAATTEIPQGAKMTKEDHTRRVPSQCY